MDCVLSDWGNWSTCSHACDGGVRTRLKSVLQAPVGEGKLCGRARQSQTCNVARCGKSPILPVCGTEMKSLHFASSELSIETFLL
jgi:hypothetical protein